MCTFCSEFNNETTSDNLFYSIASKELNLESRTIFETQNFVVLPTIGAFVEGYLLIVTKKHYTCIGGIDESMVEELNKLIITCKSIIQKQYGKNCIMFEHGSTSCSAKIGGCVDHAHLHIVPIEADITDNITHFNVKLVNIDSVKSLLEYGKKNLPYLYYCDITNNNYIVDAPIIPSQFFRQIVSKQLSVFDKWDWRKEFEIDNLKMTLEVLNSDLFIMEYQNNN